MSAPVRVLNWRTTGATGAFSQSAVKPRSGGLRQCASPSPPLGTGALERRSGTRGFKARQATAPVRVWQLAHNWSTAKGEA
jgi:hypothetical protein